MRKLTLLLYHHSEEGNVQQCLQHTLADFRSQGIPIHVLQDGVSLSPAEQALIPGGSFFAFPKQGLARTLNAGFELAEENDVLVMDTRLSLQSLERLDEIRAFAEQEGVGIVGGKLLNSNGLVFSCGRDVVNGLGFTWPHSHRGFGSKTPGQFETFQEVDAVDAELVYIRRECLGALKKLDENCPDGPGSFIDFCLVARKMNFRSFFHPGLEGRWMKAPEKPSLIDSQEKPKGDAFSNYWLRKWGWNPNAPDLHLIRMKYGATPLCWKVGEPLRYRPERRMPSVDVLIVTGNRLPFLRLTLAALEKTDYPAIRVLVLDDGSRDGTAGYLQEMIEKGKLNLEVFALPVSVGEPAGMNYLLEEVSAPLVAVLDDCTLVSPHWLKAMVPLFEEYPYTGVVGPKLLQEVEDGGLSHIHSAYCRLFPRSIDHSNTVDAGQLDFLARVSYVKGSCCLYRREVFEQAGKFDISFSRGWYEDIDHQLAVRKEGYDILYCGFVAVHRPGNAIYSSHDLVDAKGNWTKIQMKWGADTLEALEKGIGMDDSRILQHFPESQKEKKRAVMGAMAPAQEKVTIVLLNYNHRDLTRRCLESIYAHTRASFRVVVVDNGSSDGSLDTLKGMFPASFISNKANLGFAKGSNQGATRAAGKYVLFLNNDTVVTPGWLEEMIKTMEGPEKPGIVGSRLLFRDGTIQHTGVVANLKLVPHHIYYQLPGEYPPALQAREYQIVTGACLMIRADLFNELGGFDETYVNGYEDVDLCLRARQLGERVFCCGRSLVYHLEARTQGRFKMAKENIQHLNNKISSGIVAIEPDDYRYYKKDGAELWIRGRKRTLYAPGYAAPPYDLMQQFSENEAHARSALEKGRYENACEYFSNLVRLKPYDARLWIALGKCSKMAGWHEKAAYFFRQAEIFEARIVEAPVP